jgi:hypothetical protein
VLSDLVKVVLFAPQVLLQVLNGVVESSDIWVAHQCLQARVDLFLEVPTLVFQL